MCEAFMQLNMCSVNQSFKGSMALSDNGTPYYKTNNGLKTYGTCGALGVLSSFLPGESKAIALAGLGIDCLIGAYIDHKRNKHAAEAADYIKQVGLRNALATRDDIDLTDDNKPYYKSKDGGKYGTIIGAISGALAGFFPGIVLALVGATRGKDKFVITGAGAFVVTITTAAGALGGFIMGKITDYFTNRAAKKHA